MNRRGFSIIELIVVVSIMGILIVMGVVNMRDSQMNSRDVERKTDMESLALHLEIFYNSGSAITTTSGRYPSTIELIGSESALMKDLNPGSIIAPGFNASTLVAATNNNQTITGVTPAVTMDSYVYQPIQSDGSLCTVATQECRKFNLYYANEADGDIKIIQSKNQ